MPKLKNFGLSNHQNRRLVQSRPNLTPLESLLRLHSTPSSSLLPVEPATVCSYKQDVYQLGAIIYELVLERPATEIPHEHAEQYIADRWFQ